MLVLQRLEKINSWDPCLEQHWRLEIYVANLPRNRLWRACMGSCWASCGWFSPPHLGLQICGLHTLPPTWQRANCSWRHKFLATVEWWFLCVLSRQRMILKMDSVSPSPVPKRAANRHAGSKSKSKVVKTCAAYSTMWWHTQIKKRCHVSHSFEPCMNIMFKVNLVRVFRLQTVSGFSLGSSHGSGARKGHTHFLLALHVWIGGQIQFLQTLRLNLNRGYVQHTNLRMADAIWWLHFLDFCSGFGALQAVGL